MKGIRAALAGKRGLAEEFRGAAPFPHFVADDFLDDAFCRELMDAFPQFDADRARNEMGKAGRKAVFPQLASLGEPYARFDALMQSPEFLAWLGRATGIPDLLYDPEYIGGGAHLNLSGQDLDPHVDFNYHPARRWHRRLNLILFLNPRWEASWGGVLELHRDPRSAADTVSSVVPKANRCVVFETSERSWHGFRRIAMPEEEERLGRRSIAVYFYTKDRPREETEAPHGTFYRQRPLPERFSEGYTLTDADMGELRELLTRRDDQIDFLYKRELEFTRISGSASYRLARALTWPLRKLLGR